MLRSARFLLRFRALLRFRSWRWSPIVGSAPCYPREPLQPPPVQLRQRGLRRTQVRYRQLRVASSKLPNKALDRLADWVVSGTLLAHSGSPLIAGDGTSTSVLGSYNYG